MLTSNGVVASDAVAADGRGKQYRLTEVGELLRPPLLELARWGLRFLREPADTDVSCAAWGFLAVQAMIQGTEAPTVDEDYEFLVDEETFHISVADGVVTAARGPAPHAALRLITNAETFIRIGAELLTPFDALAAGLLRIEGEFEAIRRCNRLLGLSG